MDRWATFDCYGTLIDWNAGIGAAMARVWPNADPDRLLARYHEIEPRVELARAISYRRVLIETLGQVAQAERLILPDDRRDALVESLPDWPPFPEVPGALRELRRRGWKIGILSNTDGDLLASSLSRIGVPIDLRVVAGEIGSYKPAFGHWEAFFRSTGANRAFHVHVAASLFHDIAPCERLGLRAVWINRLDEESELPRAAELPNLSDLPDTLDRMVAKPIG